MTDHERPNLDPEHRRIAETSSERIRRMINGKTIDEALAKIDPERAEALSGDEERIHLAIAEWRERGSVGTIDHTTARIIASRYHGGQASALYSFQSTGRIDLDALQGEMLRNVTEFIADAEAQEELEALALYFGAEGEREAVPYWHESTAWGSE